MSDYVQFLSLVAVASASVAGVGHSIAAIIRERARGKAIIIRAESDAELARRIGVPTRDRQLIESEQAPEQPLLEKLGQLLRLTGGK